MEITEDITDFYLIGVDDEDGKLDFRSAVPQDVRVMHQTLYESIDEDFGTGDAVGFAHGAFVLGLGGYAICYLVLVIEEEHTITAHGVLPIAEETGVGDGMLAVTGGTGKFNSAGGRIDVEVVNPKKYHVITDVSG